MDYKHKPYTIEGNLWINKGTECFLGPGRLVLLNTIIKEGSIHAASKKLGLSYQHAWNTIEQLNRLSPIPVMIRKRGGSGGGGAEFTAYGKRIIEHMNKVELDFKKFIDQMNSEFNICF